MCDFIIVLLLIREIAGSCVLGAEDAALAAAGCSGVIREEARTTRIDFWTSWHFTM